MRSKFTLFIVIMFIAFRSAHAVGPIRAMFVHDNSVFFPNTETVFNSLQATNEFDELKFFNAIDSLRGPTYAEMIDYRLVIWYTSSDGVGRYFWNGDDSDNQELMLYLESGGMLWVMGNDFLYDRYGAAPVIFSEGDFASYFLGIAEYNVQSYGDDGGLGVPMMIYEENFPVTNVPDTLVWIYETLWWADGCTGVNNAIPFYRMGPADYALAGYVSGLSYIDSKSYGASVSLMFDPAFILEESDRQMLFSGITRFFQNLVPYSVSYRKSSESNLIVLPNPASDVVRISVKSQDADEYYKLEIMDQTGKIVRKNNNYKIMGPLDVRSLLPGAYILKLTGEKTADSKVLIIR